MPSAQEWQAVDTRAVRMARENRWPPEAVPKMRILAGSNERLDRSIRVQSPSIDDYLSSIIHLADSIREGLTPHALAQSDEMAYLLQEVRKIDSALGDAIGIIEEIENQVPA